MVFKNWVKSIQAAGYNDARRVIKWQKFENGPFTSNIYTHPWRLKKYEISYYIQKGK